MTDSFIRRPTGPVSTLLKPSSSAARNRNRVRGIESDGEETEYKLNGVTARNVKYSVNGILIAFGLVNIPVRPSGSSGSLSQRAKKFPLRKSSKATKSKRINM